MRERSLFALIFAFTLYLGLAMAIECLEPLTRPEHDFVDGYLVIHSRPLGFLASDDVEVIMSWITLVGGSAFAFRKLRAHGRSVQLVLLLAGVSIAACGFYGVAYWGLSWYGLEILLEVYSPVFSCNLLQPLCAVAFGLLYLHAANVLDSFINIRSAQLDVEIAGGDRRLRTRAVLIAVAHRGGPAISPFSCWVWSLALTASAFVFVVADLNFAVRRIEKDLACPRLLTLQDVGDRPATQLTLTSAGALLQETASGRKTETAIQDLARQLKAKASQTLLLLTVEPEVKQQQLITLLAALQHERLGTVALLADD